jgi:hypothetical protein
MHGLLKFFIGNPEHAGAVTESPVSQPFELAKPVQSLHEAHPARTELAVVIEDDQMSRIAHGV